MLEGPPRLTYRRTIDGVRGSVAISDAPGPCISWDIRSDPWAVAMEYRSSLGENAEIRFGANWRATIAGEFDAARFAA